MGKQLLSRFWTVRNILNATILLPEPPLDPPGLELLPIAGTAIVGERLFKALESLVEVIKDHGDQPLSYPACEAVTIQGERLNADKSFSSFKSPQSPGTNPNVSKVDLVEENSLHEFLTAWHRLYADRHIRPAQLTSMASVNWPSLLDNFPLESHGASIALGRHLASLSQQDLGLWKIIRKCGAKKTRYAVVSLDR